MRKSKPKAPSLPLSPKLLDAFGALLADRTDLCNLRDYLIVVYALNDPADARGLLAQIERDIRENGGPARVALFKRARSLMEKKVPEVDAIADAVDAALGLG